MCTLCPGHMEGEGVAGLLHLLREKDLSRGGLYVYRLYAT